MYATVVQSMMVNTRDIYVGKISRPISYINQVSQRSSFTLTNMWPR